MTRGGDKGREENMHRGRVASVKQVDCLDSARGVMVDG